MKINLLRGFLIKILPAIALLSACGHGARYETESSIALERQLAPSVMDSSSIVAQVSNAKEVQETLQSLDNELAEKLSQKKLVYAVSMKAKVKNVAQETTHLWRLARKFGGYITASDVNTRLESTKFVPFSADSLTQMSTYTVENQVVLRVPIQNLDTTLLEISKQYYFLENHHIKAEDVTLNLIDNQLKAKLFNKSSKRIEQAIEQKGEHLPEITQAEKDNADKHEQGINHQLMKLDLLDRAAFATIEIQFYQMPLHVMEKVENPATDRYEPSFESQLTDSLKIGWKLLLALIVNIAKIWFLIPVGIAAYWAYRKYYR